MSFVKNLTKIVNSISADGNVNYQAYDIRDTNFFYGVPPVPIIGVDYISASFTAARTRMFRCLTGNAVHASNLNISGTIEVGLLSGSVSGAAIQMMNFTGVPFPIFIEDGKSGGTSTVTGTACRLIDTPEWRRDRTPGLDIYTFSVDKLVISHGIRLVQE